MLIYEDFKETNQIQVTVFTPGFSFSTSGVIKKLMELNLTQFDGDPFVLPLPDDAPHDIPRITLGDKKKMYKLEVAPARINFFRNKTREDDKIITEEVVNIASEILVKLLDDIDAKCGRIAAIINRFCYKDNPGREIAEHFCQSKFMKEPFDRPSEFELHSLKKYDLVGQFKVNSWVRIKSGLIKSEVNVSRPVVFAHQDINTSVEETKSYTNEEIHTFYKNVCDEFDKIIRLYFPK